MSDDPSIDTKVIFTTGQFECEGELEVEFITETDVHKITKPLKLKRFQIDNISIKQLLKKQLQEGEPGLLKILPPKQSLFYGRLLVAQSTTDGAFSGNHTFYDCGRNRCN